MVATKPVGASVRRRSLYFPVVTTLILAMSLLAFSDNLVTDIGQPSNSDPKMVVHGLFALAWVVLFAVQAWLVFFGRTASHRKVGPWGFIAGAGLLTTTAFVFYTSFRGIPAMTSEVVANRLLLPVFAVSTYLAWRNRQRPERHKRYLMIGTFALLSPIIVRDFGPLFISTIRTRARKRPTSLSSRSFWVRGVRSSHRCGSTTGLSCAGFTRLRSSGRR